MANARTLTAMMLPLVALVTTLSVSAQPDDFLAQVNRPLDRIADEDRSETILLPALVNLETPPAALTDAYTAALMPAEGPNWDAAAEWAAAESQQAVIEALAEITEAKDRRESLRFAQGYGIEAVAGNVDLIRAGLYTELGDPPTLGQAELRFLDKLDEMEILVHVNATRLFEEDDSKGAIKSLADFVMFGRQMCDRQFIVELKWGMNAMCLAFERIRDITYQDQLRRDHRLEPEWIKNAIRRFNQRALEYDQIALGNGDFLAARQLISRVIEPQGDPSERTFATTMARIVAGGKPLRLFSEAAYWDRVRESHADWFEARDMIEGVGEDYRRRWGLDPFDDILTNPSDYMREVAGKEKFAVIAFTVQGYDDLYDLRRRLQIEYGSTGDSLAVYAYRLEYGREPPKLTSVRPRYIRGLSLDPFNRTNGANLEYFVPVRDTPKGPRGQDKPWEIEVFPTGDFQPFSVPFVDQSTCIIYSVGEDQRPEKARSSTQDTGAPTGDYLVYPPVISLLRKSLMDAGALP